jgi:GAF domain-containing protein
MLPGIAVGARHHDRRQREVEAALDVAGDVVEDGLELAGLERHARHLAERLQVGGAAPDLGEQLGVGDGAGELLGDRLQERQQVVKGGRRRALEVEQRHHAPAVAHGHAQLRARAGMVSM